MRWFERIAVSALAAGFGALITLLWLGDAGIGRDVAEPPMRDAAPAAPPRLAQLEDELAAQAELLTQLSADNAELTVRLRDLERVAPGAARTQAGDDPSSSTVADAGAGEQPEPEEPPDLPQAQLLVRSGIEPSLADAIQQRISALEMERLYLRDQATREGWRNSERFSAAMNELLRPQDVLREEFGDDVYDRYLYAMGQGNRVLVASTLQDSPADVAGIRAGDTVLSYAGKRVYSVGDLQSATAAGEPGASVVVELLRDGVRWYATVPRGPLGVRLDVTRRAPSSG
ncbi:MAG: PDZ domain-containing protein [Gammaproteobacteria bacterium]|nr:PDZ domain-containing protein [Gammaproteobacteria bacterium]